VKEWRTLWKIINEASNTNNQKLFKMKKLFLLVIIALSVSSCYRDVEKIKKVAPSYLKERGYKIVSYDGYECDFLAIQGGFVWYQVKDSDGYLYNLAISEWRGEYHIYNQKCLNAVSNK